ncbi:DUF3224 domain-containing protein [Kitasatospora sp. NPDC092039]|uniref:DUF3224 domain-containing protein n=1 Tax=Kitasatospora sp. NPDC092039 TaxID=3364086 RepID=UPI0038056630
MGSRAGGSFELTAFEPVETLDGRRGSFVLQHAAWDTSGTTIRVVPGTGTSALAGITGEFQLTVDASGTHTYVLEYELG